MKHVSIREAPVSRETWVGLLEQMRRGSCAFDDYGEILLTWNRRVNLLSRDMSTQELDLHIRHSLMIATCDAFLLSERFVDIGTGGGLPGIPLAMAFPDKHFRLVDVIDKKCHVVRDIARSLHLRNVDVVCADIRTLSLEDGEVILSKHAFKLKDVVKALAEQPWRQALFLKGRDFIDEMTDLKESIQITYTDCAYLDDDPFFAGKVLLDIRRPSTPSQQS